ncbi:hypothetical protein ES703_105554 [subsurface metagenome]
MIIPYLGIPILSIGLATGLWALIGYLVFRRMRSLIDKRLNMKFLRANFDAISMSSPYVDFYFNAHNYSPFKFKLTGHHKGELWNPRIEAWRSSWEVDTKYKDIILPEADTEIRLRWIVPQGYSGPMAEFAFRATDNPPIQHLTFDDMTIELEGEFLKLKNVVGWLQLSLGIIEVEVPDHHRFSIVREEYERARGNK